MSSSASHYNPSGRGFGRGRGSRGGRGFGQGRGRGNHQKFQKFDEHDGPKEKYAVIITNVEDKFSLLHRDALPSYCGLKLSFLHNDPRRWGTDGQKVEKADDDAKENNEAEVDETGKEEDQVEHGDDKSCYYEIKCRDDACTAEVSLYGPADGDFAPLFTTPRHEGGPQHHRGSHPHNRHQDNAEEGESPLYGTAAIQKMALKTRGQRYYTKPVRVFAHLPDRNEGDVICRVKGEEDEEDKNKNSGENEQQQQDPTTAGKRHREGEEEEDDEEKQESKKSRTEATHQEASTIPLHRRDIRQFAHRQKDFIAADASVPPQTNFYQVRQHLGEIPGFLSCRKVHAQQVRVVFASQELLFKAKQLLEQFELYSGVRLTFKLTDKMTRAYADFVQGQEAGALGAE